MGHSFDGGEGRWSIDWPPSTNHSGTALHNSRATTLGSLQGHSKHSWTGTKLYSLLTRENVCLQLLLLLGLFKLLLMNNLQIYLKGNHVQMYGATLLSDLCRVICTYWINYRHWLVSLLTCLVWSKSISHLKEEKTKCIRQQIGMGSIGQLGWGNSFNKKRYWCHEWL